MASTIGELDFPYLGATVLPRTDKTTLVSVSESRVRAPISQAPSTYHLAPSALHFAPQRLSPRS